MLAHRATLTTPRALSPDGGMRTDDDILDFIISKHESPDDATRALGIANRQTLYNWKQRGIPPGWRHAIWLWCRRHGLRLGHDWLLKSLVAHEVHSPMTTNGGSNGRTRKGKSRTQKRKATRRSTAKRQRPNARAQRRTGRGVRALAAAD